MVYDFGVTVNHNQGARDEVKSHNGPIIFFLWHLMVETNGRRNSTGTEEKNRKSVFRIAPVPNCLPHGSLVLSFSMPSGMAPNFALIQ